MAGPEAKLSEAEQEQGFFLLRLRQHENATRTIGVINDEWQLALNWVSLTDPQKDINNSQFRALLASVLGISVETLPSDINLAINNVLDLLMPQFQFEVLNLKKFQEDIWAASIIARQV